MRIVYNPKVPAGSGLKDVGYKSLSDEKGWYYSLPAGRALKFRDDVAEFLLKTYSFLKELDENGKVIFSTGHKVPPKEIADIELEKIVEFQPIKQVPNLIDRKLHPERYEETEEREMTGPDYYGGGLEEDAPGAGWAAPKSKFTKE